MFATLDEIRDTLEANLNTNNTAEATTTTTNIKVTSHGLVSGDEIINTTRSNASRVVTVVDANNLTVTAVTGQTAGDSIKFLRFKKYYVGYVKEPYNASLPCLMVYLSTSRLARQSTATDQWQNDVCIEIVTNAFGKINTQEDTDKVLRAQKQLWDLMQEVDSNNVLKTSSILGVLRRNIIGTKFKFHTDAVIEYPQESSSDRTYIRAKMTLRVMSAFNLRT